MARKKLKAEKRTESGRKVKRLRNEGIIPANVYGKGIKSLSVKVLGGDLKKYIRKKGRRTLLTLKLRVTT
jgi:large subunit ribosomal protein L25